jgi:hypothetical protein
MRMPGIRTPSKNFGSIFVVVNQRAEARLNRINTDTGPRTLWRLNAALFNGGAEGAEHQCVEVL